MREFLSFCRYLLQMLLFVRGVILALVLALFACAGFFALAENLTFSDSLYFTLITGLTIGYGDITPATAAGRVLSVVAGLIGLVVVGLIVAVATRALTLAVQDEKARLQMKE